MGKIFAYDIGTEILIDMQEDLSSATSITLRIQKPDKTTTTWTPTVVNTNYLQYYLQSGDVDDVGVYTIQPHLTIGSWTGSGTKVQIEVFARI